ncbi:MAG: hemerythrin domain-containing protein [Aestuariivirga sp.]
MADNDATHAKLNVSASPRSLLAQILVDNLDRQQAICDELEAIADSLPSRINDQVCLQISQTLPALLKQIHDFEETQLFPQLLKRYFANAELKQTTERLCSEHLSDEDFADDLCTALLTNITNVNHIVAESQGWMLRGLFENLRRHIAFEREHILPLIDLPD